MAARALLACFLACPLATAQTGWNLLAPTSSPSPREAAAMAFDSSRGHVLLFGGRGSRGDFGDTWTWSGSNWTPATPVSVPAPRSAHALAYDAARSVVVLFGGQGSGVQRNDTWTWDGADWRQHAPASRPPAREAHTLIYDAARRRVVLFGGWSGTALLDDLWEWDGTDWTQRTLAPRPPVRAGHAAAFDTEHRQTVIANGFDGGYARDSWACDSAGWRKLSSAPSGRAFAAMAEDPARRRLILFGGIGAPSSTLLDDTWIYDGSQWMQTPENPRPPARHSHAMTSNGRNGETLLFGGSGAQGLLGDTWLLRRPLAPNASFDEAFTTDAMKDASASPAGGWGGGRLIAGRLGGTGLLGDYTPGGRDVTLNTDDQTFPADATLTGRAERVVNGEFHFASLHIPAGTRVSVTGSRPARIYVRGRVRIDGELDLDAPDVPLWSSTQGQGQAGGPGRAGGGAGGRGGDPGDGIANQLRFNGQHGSDVTLAVTHPYFTQSVGTGGRGSPQYPADGRNASVTYNGLQGQFSAMVTAGGGGGGFRAAGANGIAYYNNVKPVMDLGPLAPGGISFDLLDSNKFPLPPSNPGTRDLEFFLLGGSGGGGGGTHPHFSIRGVAPQWKPGAGGAAGGGAVAIRAGADLEFGTLAQVTARGGSCAKGSAPHATPAGGGSGGSVLLQQGGVNPRQLGLLGVAGGKGGVIDERIVFHVGTLGGDGAPGLARLELPIAQPPVSLIGRVDPPAGNGSVAPLADFDRLSGYRSNWYSVQGNQVPEFLRYEIRGTVNSAQVVFSDDPAIGRLAGPGEPILFFVQGAQVDPVTGEPKPGTLSHWTPYAGRFGAGNLNETQANAVRFTVVFDAAIAATVVQRVTLLMNLGFGRFDAYGQSCGSSEYTPLLTAPAGAVPRIGQRFALVADQMRPGQPALLHIGASRTNWRGITLPFDLTPLGAPGCFVLASDEWMFPLLNATGRTLVNLDVPNDPGLRGGRFFGQVIVLDPRANALGFALTNGAAATIE